MSYNVADAPANIGGGSHMQGFGGGPNNVAGSMHSPSPAAGAGDGTGGDYGSESIFSTDMNKHDELRNMLESSKDTMKLEAMRRIIGMVAKGRNVSSLFPAVVKNVLSKSNELKKLVYVYLVRYAEEEQDLALLSISAFQKALKDRNQLIRASALRVLSSIRVPVIVPIMMLCIKDASSDMSPFVRKTASHAIPKLYSLDETQKDNLIEVIEKLLKDRTTLVAGSAVMAFEIVCPERTDLVHKNYRKLCNLLVDVDEWGQMALINMLTHYARSQFLDPNKHDDVGDKAFYSDEDEEDEEEDDSDEDSDEDSDAEKKKKKKKKPYTMDSDHRLLLRCAKPLLQSRNSGVVMSVCQLYFHTAPRSELSVVIKPMLRLLHSHREVQTVVLTNIATLSLQSKGLFEPFIKSFFVHSQDSSQIRSLKLEIMTNLASDTSVPIILKEFQTYVSSSDRDFVAATIQAIGRCASQLEDVTDTCVNGLMRLLQHRDELVVGESVVIIKKLLQLQPSEHKEIIVHLTKLVDSIKVPMARASILWLIGEYSEHVPKLAPDVLRKMAKTFSSEEDIVKLQVLNLAGKLMLINAKQTKLLTQYVFNLAKYDINYDIRDRVRYLRQLLFPVEKGPLGKYAKKILLVSKPAPVLESAFKDRQQWQVGSLSLMLGASANGYVQLVDFPEEAPDPAVRDVEVEYSWAESAKRAAKTSGKKKKKKTKKTKSDLESFYSDDSDEDSDDEDDSDDDEDDSDEDDSDEEDSDEEGSDEEDSDEETDDEEDETDDEDDGDWADSSSEGEVLPSRSKSSARTEDSDEEETESSEEEDSDDEEDSDEESEDESVKPVAKASKPSAKSSAPAKTGKASKAKASAAQEVSLLDLGDFSSPAPAAAASGGAAVGISSSLLQPATGAMQALSLSDNIQASSAVVASGVSHELLNRISGRGLAANYQYTRRPHLFSEQMVDLEVTISNHSDAELHDIAVTNKKLEGGMTVHEFDTIGSLDVGESRTVSLGVDFKDTLNPAVFDLSCRTGKFQVKIPPIVGEIIQGAVMTEADFKQRSSQLKGMNESSGQCSMTSSQELAILCQCVLRTTSLALVQRAGSSDADAATTLFFAGRTTSAHLPVLLRVALDGLSVKLTCNCEKMVIGSILLKEVKAAISKL